LKSSVVLCYNIIKLGYLLTSLFTHLFRKYIGIPHVDVAVMRVYNIVW